MDGINVRLLLAVHLSETVCNSVLKDVDGATQTNLGSLLQGVSFTVLILKMVVAAHIPQRSRNRVCGQSVEVGSSHDLGLLFSLVQL